MNKLLATVPRPILYIGAVATAGILFAHFVFPYTVPFVIAIILAAILDPLVELVNRKLRFRRGLAVFAVLLVLFAFFIVIGVGILLTAVSELQDLAFSAQRFAVLEFQRFETWIQSFRSLQEYVPENFSIVIEESIADINNLIANTARSTVTIAVNLVRDIPRLFIYTLVTFLATFFMSKDKEKIGHSLLQLVPDHFQNRSVRILRGILSGAMGYVRAQLIIVTVTALIATTSFLLTGVNYVWFLAILIFILDFIPVIGPSLVLLPWAGYAAFQGDFRTAVFYLLTYAMIAATRQVLEPKLIGDRIGVHPLLTLFSLFVGVQLLGLIGFFLGPFLVITIKALFMSADEIHQDLEDAETQ